MDATSHQGAWAQGWVDGLCCLNLPAAFRHAWRRVLSIKGPETRFRGWVSGPPATPSSQALIIQYYNDGLGDY